MENSNQRNLNVPQQSPVNPIPPTKLNNKIIAIIILAIIAAFVSFLALKKSPPMVWQPINPCDIDQDGDCDAQDKQFVTNALGQCAGSNSFNELADADHNGCVTLADLNLLFPTNERVLKIFDDGTAYVKGEVVDHISGCEVDGACKLILKVNDQNVALVYAEGDMECSNTQASLWVNWGKNVNKGTRVKAYGAVGKVAGMGGQYMLTYELTFCGSKDYFILGADDPVPVGAYTEKFFDEVIERKAQVTNDNSPSQASPSTTLNTWKTYSNKEYKFEIKIPPTGNLSKLVSKGMRFTFPEWSFEIYPVKTLNSYPSCYFTEELKTNKMFGSYEWTSCDRGWFTWIPEEVLIVAYPDNNLSANSREEFESILSTFKFTK